MFWIYFLFYSFGGFCFVKVLFVSDTEVEKVGFCGHEHFIFPSEKGPNFFSKFVELMISPLITHLHDNSYIENKGGICIVWATLRINNMSLIHLEIDFFLSFSFFYFCAHYWLGVWSNRYLLAVLHYSTHAIPGWAWDWLRSFFVATLNLGVIF
jgi:hypothetical protein